GTATYTVVPTCVRAAPTVAISPTSQSAVAGTAAAYTATITNNDTACAANSVGLTAALPAGWTATLSSSPGALAAGGSTSVTWTVTSKVGAANGDTVISATATSATSGAGTGDATYTVTPACVRAMPTVAISPPSQIGAPGSQLAYTATITNNDTACA